LASSDNDRSAPLYTAEPTFWNAMKEYEKTVDTIIQSRSDLMQVLESEIKALTNRKVSLLKVLYKIYLHELLCY
jgi:hypothetical protein